MATYVLSPSIKFSKLQVNKKLMNTAPLLKRIDGCIETLRDLHEAFETIRGRLEEGVERNNLRSHLSPEIYTVVTLSQNLHTFSFSLQNEVNNIERGIYDTDAH